MSGPVLPLAVLDPSLLGPAGRARARYYLAALAALRDDLRRLGGDLLVRAGAPERVLPAVVAEHRARSVHVSADFGPYGRQRDIAVRRALGDVPLVASGSPYAVRPGRIATAGGSPYRVFSAFYRAWLAHGWPPAAAGDPAAVSWYSSGGGEIPTLSDGAGDVTLPPAGEAAALRTWGHFQDTGLAGYGTGRDRPDLDASSHLSPHLKVGAIHPRTLLMALGPNDEAFRRELAWREFYAAALFAWPASARTAFAPAVAARLPVDPDRGGARLAAWTEGRTGYPIVDAGMRQLQKEAFLPNRVRMIVASFLVKDLHLDWRQGARHFLAHLADGDLASNQLGWQWVAGTGPDAAPVFRIFNPTTQAKRFDPHGAYVRRHVVELAALPDELIHEPWRAPGGPPGGYPLPVVVHDEERQRVLDSWAAGRRSADDRSARRAR